MFSYNPLWKTLVDKKMKKTDLINITNLSSQTIADMGKDKYVSMSTLDKICNTLNCDISNVIQHIPNNE
ncbi:MAG: helix-turn-helix domain-containing protein [Clostridia bacterium]|nr:helix-turn-helix domain-containing protein [Clostridia bacterium]